jgi:hypothetical protein
MNPAAPRPRAKTGSGVDGAPPTAASGSICSSPHQWRSTASACYYFRRSVGLTFLAFPIGFVLSYAIMAILYSLIIGPIAVLLRLFDRDSS